VTDKHWVPAVILRAGDRIVCEDTVRIIEEDAKRINTGPTYRIATDHGDIVAGAAQRIQLLKGESDDHGS